MNHFGKNSIAKFCMFIQDENTIQIANRKTYSNEKYDLYRKTCISSWFFFLLDARQYCRLHFFSASLDCVNKMKEKKVRVKKKLLVLPDITILWNERRKITQHNTTPTNIASTHPHAYNTSSDVRTREPKTHHFKN